MQKKFLNYIKNLNSFILLGLIACSNPIKQNKKVVHIADNMNELSVRCTKDEKMKRYELGDLPCTRQNLIINSKEKLEIRYKVLDPESKDIYKRGYQELNRYINGKVVEKLKLRKEEDPYWNETPFVRLREKKFLADIDEDGFLEFAIFPFSPGSAIWGTVRIYSLKNKIEFWGEGRYQFENDTFVQLNCMKCSKFNPEECNKCE